MRFEWDDEKNKSNIRKHGFDFADAWEIFEAPLLAGLDEREDYGEDRWIGIGSLKGQIVVIVFAELDAETIRVISLRKAMKHERIKYEQAIRDGLGTN
ncbi:MAG: BrnT family toxin [Acidobacteriota bacterium]